MVKEGNLYITPHNHNIPSYMRRSCPLLVRLLKQALHVCLMLKMQYLLRWWIKGQEPPQVRLAPGCWIVSKGRAEPAQGFCMLHTLIYASWVWAGCCVLLHDLLPSTYHRSKEADLQRSASCSAEAQFSRCIYFRSLNTHHAAKDV